MEFSGLWIDFFIIFAHALFAPIHTDMHDIVISCFFLPFLFIYFFYFFPCFSFFILLSIFPAIHSSFIPNCLSSLPLSFYHLSFPISVLPLCILFFHPSLVRSPLLSLPLPFIPPLNIYFLSTPAPRPLPSSFPSFLARVSGRRVAM